MSKSIKKSKYTFTFFGMRLNDINSKYNIESIKEKQCRDTTEIQLLNKNQIISFLDESKNVHNCQVSVIDFTKKDMYNCFWCKSKFNTYPIGCPTKYIPNKITRTYFSNISKDNYSIRCNITSDKLNKIQKTDGEISLQRGCCYETDGVFCSFNCCKAYIEDNKHVRLYDVSNTLLLKMYNNMMNTKMGTISSAPHWRNLKVYGGHLELEEFRKTFNKIDYEYHGDSHSLNKYLPIKNYYEEKIKF
jgi:hypothetical protein